MNNLVVEINELDAGISDGDRKLSLLLYVDEIVLTACDKANLQQMLDKLNSLCQNWRNIINTENSKCIPFRKGQCLQTEYEFKVGKS